MPVHQRHVEFEFKIGKRAQSADDGGGFLFDGEINQQPIEGCHPNVAEIGDVGLDHFDALFCGEERTFAGVAGDGQRHLIEESRRATEDIKMSVCDRVERARVNAVAHGERVLARG